jgi:hypothetical protein
VEELCVKWVFTKPAILLALVKPAPLFFADEPRK